MDILHLLQKTCRVNAPSGPRVHFDPLSLEQFETKKKSLELAISSLTQYKTIADHAEASGAAAVPRDVISDVLSAFQYDEMVQRRMDVDATFQNVSCFVPALVTAITAVVRVYKTVTYLLDKN